MPFPTFAIGPAWSVARWARSLHQSRRKVKLTVHRAYRTYAMAAFVGGVASTRALSAVGPDPETIEAGGDEYFVTVTNASRDRDIVVTHVWFDMEPRVDLLDQSYP